MAAASPTFPISKETTNYARLCVLLVDVGSQVLRETFDRKRPPGPLDTVLGTPPTSDTLKSLLKRKVLNPSQRCILYPTIKSSVSSENFDITLLMLLLRNICGLTAPAAGWDALPSPTDVNCEDDLARIKYYRNTVHGHAAQASVDDTKFNDYWMNIRDTLVRLGGMDYQAPIDGLQYACMDRDTEERYIEMLKQWKADEDVIGDVLKDKINNVEAKVDNVQASVNNVEAKVDNVQAVVDRIETQLVPAPVFTSNTVTRGGNDDDEIATIYVVNNIESINLGGRVISIRDLANSCRMHQAAGRSGGMIIIPVDMSVAQEEQVEDVEGTVPGQNQEYQQYVPTENDIWEVVLSFKNCLNTFLNYLNNKLNVLVRGHHLGSLLIATDCSSLEILEGLWKDYKSGHLQEVAQEALVTSDVLKTLGVTGIKLKTLVSEEEYEKGKTKLVENFGEPDHVSKRDCTSLFVCRCVHSVNENASEATVSYVLSLSKCDRKFLSDVTAILPLPVKTRKGKTKNYARLCRLLVDVGSMVLRETFDKTRPPGGLDSVLGSPSVSATLQSLRRMKILNPLQWSKLYPAIKSSVSSEKFDITLLMVLLKSICGLTAPATGWDNLPLPTDVSCAADIARIKFYRNTLYTHAQTSVDDTTFDHYWTNIRDTLVRLGGAAYETAIDDLRYDRLDSDMEEHYKEHLRQWKVDEDITKDKFDNAEVKEDEQKPPANEIEKQSQSTSGDTFHRSMALAALTFPSPQETANYARLCHLLLNVGSKVLSETFDKTRPPGSLDSVLGSPSVSFTLQSLRRKKILNPLQWSKLYPAIKSSVSSEKFDIPLLVVLLRSICGLTPPATGWDNLPLPTDLTYEADIARIKFYRNTVYAHATQASIDDVTFENYWKDIRDTLVRLGGAAYEEAIDGLRYDCLDPDMEEHYEQLLKQWKLDDDNIKDKQAELKASVDKIEKRLQLTSEETNKSITRSELPEKETNIYGRTREIERIVQALSEKSGKTFAGVLVSGTAGVGKSTVVIQAGHWLKNEFEAVVKFCSLRGAYKGSSDDDGAVREILNVCVAGNQQVSDYPRHVLLNWCRQLEIELILIVDNVEDAIKGRDKYHFLNLLSEMRMCSDCKIKFLITSSSEIETVGTFSNIPLLQINLGPLDVEESIEVLKNAANLTTADNDPNTDVRLHEIARLCENIPLALRLAGPLLAFDSEYTFEELKQKLEKNPTSTLGVKPMMEIAFERLDESLQRALVSLSVFPQSFKRDAAEAILGDGCAEALTNLKKRCLIQKQNDRYLIHLLIRSYAKQIGERDEFGQILANRKQSYLKHFLSLILTNAQKYWGKDTCKESFKLFDDERVNIESVLQDVAGGQKKVQNCQELEDVVDACGQVAPYIEDCVPFKLYGNFLNGLLQCSQCQGNTSKQVEILCLLYDESRRRGGDKNKSKELIDQAIRLHDSNLPVFEQNRLSEAFYLSHYGRYLSQDCGARDEAQPLLKQALSIVEKEIDEHASTFDLGRVLSQMGHNARLGHQKTGKRKKEANERRRKEALKYFQEALHFRQSHYGEHVVTALAHKDLAGHYLAMEDFCKAEENYEAAVRIFEGMGMMKQKEAIPTYKNFGRCYEKSGKIDPARRILEMGREIADATIEGNHKWKVEINTCLALLLYKHYPHESTKAVALSENVFHMAKELKMDMWHGGRELLETFYKSDRHEVTTI